MRLRPVSFLTLPHGGCVHPCAAPPARERLIGSDPDAFYLRRGRTVFDQEALAEYRRCFTNLETIHIMCEDYHAGATIDMQLDEEDQKAGRRITCPVQALWGRKSGLDQWYDVLAVWREWANNYVEGHAIGCGHYLAEEAPEDTLAALQPFLAMALTRVEPEHSS